MRSFLDRWALWIGVAVLVAGIAAYTATRLVSNDGGSAASTATSASGPSVPLDPQARAVAKTFVATAVARKNLVEAWNLAAPVMRQDLTLAQWKTGTIPVQPYPVGKAQAEYTVQSSHPDTATLRVVFTPPPGSSTPAGDFLITLDRSSGKWLVSSWVPREVVGSHG
ncbi:MAG TPA: hypothetical protein VMJ49_07965 [Gaiellaceae bacterium]|nr:hypothetical protein [Gaiellaceae bacterium]